MVVECFVRRHRRLISKIWRKSAHRVEQQLGEGGRRCWVATETPKCRCDHCVKAPHFLATPSLKPELIPRLHRIVIDLKVGVGSE